MRCGNILNTNSGARTWHFSPRADRRRRIGCKIEPVFHTRCGYREKTPTTDIYRDYQNGKRPPAMATPKIETLIERYKPTIVIVQLGTNWMDQTFVRQSHPRCARAVR